jgi:hypothetical protein
MAVPEKAIYAILAGDAGIATEGVGGRIFLRWAPSNEPLPLIVYRRIGIDHEEDMSGSSGLAYARIEVMYFTEDQLASCDLAEAGRSEQVERGKDVAMVEMVAHEYDMAYAEAIPA